MTTAENIVRIYWETVESGNHQNLAYQVAVGTAKFEEGVEEIMLGVFAFPDGSVLVVDETYINHV